MNERIGWEAVLAAAVVVGLSALTAFAQRGGGQQAGFPRYDPSTEVTVQGTVEKVSEQTGTKGWHGTHLELKTKDGTLDVHVGPTAYLTEKNFQFSSGDQIEVTGSKVKFDGGEAVIAREIKKGEQTVILRNKDGVPLWSRGRRQ